MSAKAKQTTTGINRSLNDPSSPESATSSAQALIRFEGVSKTFPARKGGEAFTALKNIDLAVQTGSILGVIGRSGAGKSTLIRLVNGLERPSSGRIVVDGIDISALSEADLRQTRRSIGMIFQHFNLLSSRTVAGNVAFPMEIAGRGKTEIDTKVTELLDLVGLADKRDRYPAELSGGQKQRVGIARALANSPKVLLSDEATSALDPETTYAILDLLKRINAELKLTILLITHEMSVIRSIAREVAVIDGGGIVEQGESFDIFTRPRHDVTRSFLAQETGHALPSYFAAHMKPAPVPGGQVIVRIGFRGPNATTPVLARLAQDKGIAVNIMSGTVDEIAGRPFGTLVVGVPNQPEILNATLGYLADLELDAEVLGYVG